MIFIILLLLDKINMFKNHNNRSNNGSNNYEYFNDSKYNSYMI